MAGETNLDKLLQSLSVVLHDDVYVFVTRPVGEPLEGLNPRMLFQEAEGTTLFLRKAEAEAHALAFEFPCRMVTLNIHSSLEAVGFMARIATELAKYDMGVNPVSGFYHDHLFVPDGREADAVTALENFARSMS